MTFYLRKIKLYCLCEGMMYTLWVYGLLRDILSDVCFQLLDSIWPSTQNSQGLSKIKNHMCASWNKKGAILSFSLITDNVNMCLGLKKQLLTNQFLSSGHKVSASSSSSGTEGILDRLRNVISLTQRLRYGAQDPGGI